MKRIRRYLKVVRIHSFQRLEPYILYIMHLIMTKTLIREMSNPPFYEVLEENEKLSEIICRDFSTEYFFKNEYKHSN